MPQQQQQQLQEVCLEDVVEGVYELCSKQLLSAVVPALDDDSPESPAFPPAMRADLLHPRRFSCKSGQAAGGLHSAHVQHQGRL